MLIVPAGSTQLAPNVGVLARVKLSVNGAVTGVIADKENGVVLEPMVTPDVPRRPARPGPGSSASTAEAAIVPLISKRSELPCTWKSSVVELPGVTLTTFCANRVPVPLLLQTIDAYMVEPLSVMQPR